MKAMREYLEAVLTHTRATCTSNLIEKFMRFNIALNDVVAIAHTFAQKLKHSNSYSKAIKKVEKVLMSEKSMDAKMKVKSTKNNINTKFFWQNCQKKNFCQRGIYEYSKWWK